MVSFGDVTLGACRPPLPPPYQLSKATSDSAAAAAPVDSFFALGVPLPNGSKVHF